jgi:tRNA-2-methylthio-N6-dimethylallyladenosine synthase
VNSFGKGNPNVKQRVPLELHNAIGPVGPRPGEENFPQLLRQLDSDPRCAVLKRIRFTSSTPLDFSDELIDCYKPAADGGVTRLAAHLHLPVQSGSDRILKKMNRHHPIEAYIAQMNRLKAINPDVGLSTDLIVGFPTETEEDFQATLRLLDAVQYDNIYAFAYSPRPGTRAAKMADDVPDDVKNRRLNELLAYQLKIAESRYRSRVGRVMEVLVEGEAKNQSMARGAAGAGRVWTGRTTCNRVVNFVDDGSRPLVGRFVDVRITGATSLSLQGELIHDALVAERAASAGTGRRSDSPEAPASEVAT